MLAAAFKGGYGRRASRNGRAATRVHVRFGRSLPVEAGVVSLQSERIAESGSDERRGSSTAERDGRSRARAAAVCEGEDGF